MHRKKLKTEQRGVRKSWYILMMILLAVLYFVGNNLLELEWVAEVFAAVVAIVTAVAFWLEYHENKVLNQAQFAIDLNEQFIGSEKMSFVEWELEKFYSKYDKDGITESDKELIKKEFREKFDIEKEERQYLVNYLVHLEGIAVLVKSKVLPIKSINDLMSYRYFIAMNNPVVQELELKAFPGFYKGCTGIYDDWVDTFDNKNEIPMYKEHNLTNELK